MGCTAEALGGKQNLLSEHIIQHSYFRGKKTELIDKLGISEITTLSSTSLS